MTLEVTVSNLTVGDIIIHGKARTQVRRITPCSLTTLRGVPKIHVNDTDCYDSIATVTVERKRS